MVGCYFTLRGASTLEIVILTIDQQPIGKNLLVACNFNTHLELPDVNDDDEVIVAVMATEGLGDIKEHFLLRKLP